MADISALRALSQQIPVANQRLVTQQKAARDLQVQQVAGQMGPTPAPEQAAQVGAAVAQNAGQQQIENAQKGMQQQTQLASQAQDVQGQEGQSRVFGLQQGLQQQQFDAGQKLANISESAKQEMFDSRMEFAGNEMNRKFSNDRQLADYARLRARNDEDWANYKQQTMQLAEKNSQVLSIAYAKITQQLQFEADQIEQLRNQATRKGIAESERNALISNINKKIAARDELARQEAELKRSMDRDAARKRNKNMIISEGVGIATGVGVGILAENPQAGMAGYSVGKGLASTATATQGE